MTENWFDVCAKLIGIYSLLIICIGTIGNFLGVIVCLQNKLRQTPTFVFTAFSLANDIIALYFWNVDHFLYAFQNYQMEYISVNVCRLSIFMQMFSLEWSAWLLVSIFKIFK